ncbi:hypothetical protein SAMN05421788_11078 [Filimonas lacunae]|uniref:Uncharacterized protein n=1 Tax=Filimonas lacunae TaxID=477680 RepID=A0A173MA11_9BACT|nr:hypothetical protein [Filimonas lacunae]BAV04350.1 hypothetical protein FLA_0338 [Filimonas lacunae]SIT31102.1 hypothetical protein SAMN05421788_11078 [Filimonas lacunae]
MKVGYLAAITADNEEKKKKGLLSFTKSLFSRSSRFPSTEQQNYERGLRTSQGNARKQDIASTAWAADYNNP